VLGAGIYMAAQIFNLEEHWPGGIMLGFGRGPRLAGARQWRKLYWLRAIPWWLMGEWTLATEKYGGAAWNIAAKTSAAGLLYVSASPGDRTVPCAWAWSG